jgi:hypothetical protein
MSRNTCFHCQCHAQSLMNSCEIVIHEIKRNRVLMVFSFFENTLVKRVNRRITILIDRFWRSVWLVEMCFISGIPEMTALRAHVH